MCGIFGSNKVREEIINDGLDQIASRGPDQRSITKAGPFLMGANRLAIQAIGHNGDQPYVNDRYTMVYNGELWSGDFAEGSSDGQYILDQITKYGTDIIKTLDGMFALAIYDNQTNQLILARDSLGEIPLYYSLQFGRFSFGSEQKSFFATSIVQFRKQIQLLSPGSILTYDGSNMTIETFYTLPKTTITDDVGTIAKRFRTTLEHTVSKRIPKEVDYTVMLSGGLDSTIITYLLSRQNPRLEAFTVHVGDNAKATRMNDLYYAREVAKWLGIKLHEVILTEEQVIGLIDDTVYTIEDKSWTQVASGLAHIAMIREIKKYGFKVVFGGGGSDEIFASYPAHKRWQWKDDQYDAGRRGLISNIHKTNIIRENKCTLSEGIELRSPFMDPSFVNYAINIPIEYRYLKNRMKPVLRMAFEGEIPEHILWREKVCEGEGTDVDRILKPRKDEIKSIYDRLFP